MFVRTSLHLRLTPHTYSLMSEPYLSEDQQIALFHATGRRIASIVTGTRGKRISEQVPEIAAVPLLGAFVSLKRNGELRSCMGTMSDQMPLGDAVEQAAIHASKDDPRFPPLAAAELFELDMEIWLLWGMKRVAARGEERAKAVIVGQHGLQIARGGNRGLLLPGVALDYGMDARQFLEAVCRKAGLPTDAWLDDRALLHIFEGRPIAGPLAATENIDKKTADEMIFAAKFNRLGPRVPGPSISETEDIRQICLHTFRGMVEGIAPANYFPGLFDGNVSGVSLMFTLPERPPLVCSKISVRPDVHLQGAVVELLRVLGRQVERIGATLSEVREAKIDVAVFWDPTIHGNAARQDISSLDSAFRSLMLSSPQGWVVQFDPNRDIEEILADTVDFLKPDDLDTAEVISFETAATTSKLFLTSVSKPIRGPENRPAAVAGAFYPADAERMNAELDKMLAGAVLDGVSANKRRVSAVMVPHAGWIYSGKLAAQTLAGVEIPNRVIILAPKHRPGGVDWAVAPNKTWTLPGMSIESDLALAESLVNMVDFCEFDSKAHAEEHAIEVQLPILARLAPTGMANVKIVGLVMALTAWPLLQKAAAQFAAFLESLDETPLLIVSSDMNHFANEETTRRVDRQALDALQKAVAEKRPDLAYATVLENQISMCGIVPMVFVMESLRKLGRLNKIDEVGYTTSAAVSGDTDRVVGYAGLVLD